MFAKFNEDHNLDILIDEHCTPQTLELFVGLLHTLPVPDLKLLQILSAKVILQAPKKSSHLPKFPFFRYVCEAVDKYIDESREKVNKGTLSTLLQGNADQLQGDPDTSIAMATSSLRPGNIDLQKKSKKSMEAMYCKVVTSQIKVHEIFK